MKTIITLVTIMAFIYIVYKRKLSPALSKRKEQQNTAHDAGNGTGNADSDTKTAFPPGTPPIPVSGLTCDARMRYRVLVFNYAEYETATDFEEQMESKLLIFTSRLVNRGFPYRLDFVTIGTSIVALATYLALPETMETPD